LTPGFKYHVVTLAAVFFALTIGLVVGSLFVSPHVESQLTNEIQQQRTTLMQQNDSLRQKLDLQDRFLKDVVPAFLSGKLSGMPIAILQTGDFADVTDQVRTVLQSADARVLSVTTIEHSFGRPDELLKPTLTTLQSNDNRFPADRSGLARSIANILTHGDSPTDGFMAALERAGFVQTNDDNDYQTPARYVVIVAGSRTEDSLRPANEDQPLIEALQAQGVTVVACEPEDCTSDIGTYRTLNIDVATVDNVDTDIGHCALVYALRGDKDDYGTKQTAKHLVPSSLVKSY
jgi:intracellular sulfur oxidation DsrE/DsrF family protein